MRARSFFLLPLLLLGCSSATPETAKPEVDAGSDAGGPVDAGPADAPFEEPIGPPIGAAAPPKKIVDDAVTVMGITDDGWIVYRSSAGVVAIPSNGSTTMPTVLSVETGMVHIHGKVVFVFTQVDWANNVGELTIWTAAHGVKPIGPAMYGDDTAFVSADGSWIGWIGNMTLGSEEIEAQGDVVLATPDLAKQQTVLPAIGIGSKNTCRPRVGFVGQRLFAASCAPKSQLASLQTFDAPAWAPVTVAQGITPTWATDEAGETVFYTDAQGGAWIKGESGAPAKLDTGVGWGTLVPDGSAVLYIVADQLRRSPLPNFKPAPIITTGFVSRVAFSPDHSRALYSTQVNYDNGVHRNLLLTPTEKLNMTPERLLDEPVAEMSRSVFTTNGYWVLYLVAGADGKKTLTARSVRSPTVRTIENADTLIAGQGSRVIYSDNRSGPETYPITADLKVMDPSAAGDPVTLQTGTTDGRNFHVSADGSEVVFAMPPQGETPSALYVQTIP